MGWLSTSQSAFFPVARDKQTKTLYDGDFVISGTVTNSWWRDPTEEERQQDPTIYRVLVTERTPWSTVIHVTAVAEITVVVEEQRGVVDPTDLPQTQIAGDKTISWSRNDGSSGVVASGTMVLKECQGTEITYSARRVNEADGWTVTRTTKTITTSVSAPECTIT